MMTIAKTSFALALVLATASNSEAANLRQVQRNLGATYAKSSDFFDAMLARVNKERAAEGLHSLCANKKLQSSSQRHSNDMAEHNYMAHDGTDGSTMSERITEAGYKWSAVGENVAAGQVDVDAVMEAWMNSPEHRANIMGDYTMLGASYAYNENTEYQHYWTQDFGKGDTESCDSDTITSANNHGSDNQDQIAQNNADQVVQNEDDVQGDADTKETPVPKTAAHVTEAPKTPCPEEKSEQKTTPAPTTPAPELTQQSGDETENPGKVSPAKECDPKF